MKNIRELANFPFKLDIEKLISENPELKGAENKLKEFEKYLKPHVFWCEFKIEKLEDGIVYLESADEEWQIDSMYLSLGLKECQKVTILGATIGKNLGKHSELCIKEGRYYEASIADIFGSHAVELLVESFQNYLSQAYLLKGLYPSLRFSPGYGDWKLKDQRKIVTTLNTIPIIKVTESFLLEPIKSVTALIGWSNTPKKRTYPIGNKKKGFCQGGDSCAFCRTWACRK